MSSSLSEALKNVHLGESSRQSKRPEKKPNVSEPEDEEEDGFDPSKPFRFFDLPSEIRLRVYGFVLFTPRRKRRRPPRPNGSVGASSRNPPICPSSHRVSLFLASRRIHHEASHYFYSQLIFRLFPIQDYCRTPTVRSIPFTYLPSLASIELILGSSWTDPPQTWTVGPSLGLEQMDNLQTLRIFIECDPSHPIFEGFRISKEFYTDFSGAILKNMLKRLPNLVNVEFDGYPSVHKNGDLMRRLLRETRAANKKIMWGPQRGWTDSDPEEPPKPMVYELRPRAPTTQVSPQGPELLT